MRLFLFLTLLFPCMCQADEPAVRVFEGTVRGHKGKPIRGASVEWGHFDAEHESREIVRTDEDGRFRMETTKVGPDYRLGVSAAGFAPQWFDGLIPKLKAEKPAQVEFNLKLPTRVRGRIVDRNGDPIAGLTVYAQSPVTGFYSSFSIPTPSFPYPGPRRKSVTDEDGNFLIRNLPPNAAGAEKGAAYQLCVERSSSYLRIGKAYSKEDVSLVVSKSSLKTEPVGTGEIIGKVFDSETEEPIKDFGVVVRHRPEMTAFSDPSGEFRLTENFSAGRRYQVFVYADGYAPCMFREIPSVPGKRINNHCPLVKNKGLSGTVTGSNGQPIENAEIVFGYGESDNFFYGMGWDHFSSFVDGHMSMVYVQRIKTKKDGKFAFCLATTEDQFLATQLKRKPKSGPMLMIKAPGYIRKILTVEELGKLSVKGDVDLQLESGGEITGQVGADGDGKRWANLMVYLGYQSDNHQGWSEDTTTDSEGRFRFESLPPGNFTVSVYHQSGNSMTARLSRLVKLEQGETASVLMDGPQGKFTLSGTAQPFSMVSATPASTSAEHPFSLIGAIADADGKYVIEGLRAETYTVRSQSASAHQGFRSTTGGDTVTVDGDTILDLWLKPIELEVKIEK